MVWKDGCKPISNSIKSRFDNLRTSTKWVYLNWSGRWAGIGLETLLLSTTTLPSAYPWLVFMLIVIQYLLLYLAIWNFVEDARLAAYLSAVTASVYWATMPDRQTGIFW